MPLIKLQSEGLNLADNFAFTGTVTGAGGGKVLQVVTNHDNTEKALSTGTTMTNYAELNTSITPSATNSSNLKCFESCI